MKKKSVYIEQKLKNVHDKYFVKNKKEMRLKK